MICKALAYFKSPPLWGLFLSLILFSEQGKAQSATPFFDGEYLAYELVYQWGPIWVNAGMATFTARDTIVEGKNYWHFRGYGRSYDHWDWFYEVRSGYESFADQDLRSLRFMRKGQEGSTIYDRDYHVKQDTIYFSIKDDKEQARFGKLERREEALDVVTAIYNCRNIPFENYQENDSIPLVFYLDGNYYDSYLRYRGVQTWEHPKTEKTHECLVFTPNLIEGTIFKEGEKMTVYVSNDDRRIPIYIETELRVGKARIFLLSNN